MKKTFFIISFLCFLSLQTAQSVDIVKQLKMVEKGQINQAQVDLENLKSEYPDHPDIIFLDAVLTSDGNIAFEKYSRVYQIFPDSRFADASVFRMFSYHLALGEYSKAKNYKVILEDEYPRSPYIKIAEKNLTSLNSSTVVSHKPESNQKSNSQKNNTSQNFSVKNTEVNFSFTIQAGAFISKENASKLNLQFANRGFPTHILKKDIAGSILNIVTVGEFETMDEARTALQSINREYNIKGRIIRPEDYN